ncbi:MAG: chromate transporter [Burkholderiales bacterium]|nr:chromate transporter [Burkholderiales bacterium]
MKGSDQLVDMALLYVSLGFLCIGGSLPLIPDMHRFFVETRGLMTTAEFAGYIALAQVAPGPNILYVALFGYHVAGIPGALTVLVSVSVAPFVTMIFASYMFERLQTNPWREIVLRGLAPVTVGLMFAGCMLLTRGFADWRAWLLAGIAFPVFMTTKLHPLWMIGAGALAGVVFGL